MPLGLNDLNKKRSPTKKSIKEKHPTGAWSGRSQTTRPWSAADLDGLAKAKSRKRDVNVDAVMNEEWINLSATPLFWVNFQEGSRWYALQERLVNFESLVTNALVRSRQMLKRMGVRL